MVRPRSHLLALLVLGCAFAAAPTSAPAQPGDPIAVADDELAAPGTFLNALHRVSLQSGAATQITAAGALPEATALAITGRQTLVTVGFQTLGRFNFSTGEIDNVAAPGELKGVALAPDGSIVAIDAGAPGTAADGRVLVLDPDDGSAVELAAGGLLHNPFGVAIAEDEAIYVTNLDGTGNGQVVRVLPGGDQSIVASTPLVVPWGIAFLPNGDLVVADAGYNDAFRGALVRIDPETAEQTPSFLENLNGPIENATGVAVDAAGEVLVTERNSAQIDRVDLETGVAQLVGDDVVSPLDVEPEPGVGPTTTFTGGPSGRTRDQTPTFTFEPSHYGSMASCLLDRGPAVPCQRSFTTPTLSDGVHSLQVTSTYLGTEGPRVIRNFIVDPSALDTVITDGPSDPTNDATPTFAFEAPGGGTSFTCNVDAAAPSPCATPFTVTPALADGPHSFTVRANNDDIGDTRDFTVDTVAPQTTITSGPGEDTSTAQVQPTFTFASGEDPSTFSCVLDTTTVPCGSVFTPALPLGEGSHTLTVSATDAAGNPDLSPAVRNFRVDTTAPVTTITGGAEGATDVAAPTFTFTASEGGVLFRCSIDSETLTPCDSPFTVAPALPDGPHTFRVQAVDGAGNTGAPVRRDFAVDTVIPETSITAGPSGPTNEATPSFAFESTKAGSTFACSLNGGDPVACESPFQAEELEEGPHTFAVTATDAAGRPDPTAATRSFTVDLTPPDTLPGPFDPLTNDRTPEFSFASELGATFGCRLDGGPTTPCTSPFTTPALADGAHTLALIATDQAGNPDPTPPELEFTVDTVAPSTTIDGGPNGDTTDRRPTFSFDASEAATFACRLDGGVPVACGETFKPDDPLALGAHAFEVTATDLAGNAEPLPARRDFRVVEESGVPTPPKQPPTPPTPPRELVSPQLRLRASLQGRLLRIRIAAAPTATGRVTLELSARVERKRLVRNLELPLSAGRASAKLRLPPGIARLRLLARYLGDAGHLPASLSQTARQNPARR